MKFIAQYTCQAFSFFDLSKNAVFQHLPITGKSGRRRGTGHGRGHLPERICFSKSRRNLSKKRSWLSVQTNLLMTLDRLFPSGTCSKRIRWRTQCSIFAPPTGTIRSVINNARTKRTNSVRSPTKRKGKSDSASSGKSTPETKSNDSCCSTM